MTSDISTTIATYLQSAGFGDLGINLFIDYWPSDPDAMIAVFSGVGHPASHGMGNYTQLRNPTIQVVVRGGSSGEEHLNAKLQAEAIYRLLDTTNLVIGDTTLLHIAPVDEPHLIEHDENDRPAYTINFELSYEAPQTDLVPTPVPPEPDFSYVLDGGAP